MRAGKEPKTRNGESRNRGFSLVELLVAIAVLSIVVLPTLKVFVTSTKTTSKSRTELQANISAQSVLESANAFSIYVFDTQCNKTYNDGNASSFNLMAGTAGTSFVSSSYGGTVGTVVFEEGKIKEVTKAATGFRETAEQYAYAINGIDQSGNKFDAVVVFTKNADSDNREVSIGSGSVSASSAKSIANSSNAVFNLKYDVTVYIYKHADTPAYIGKDPAADSEVLVTLTGSKLDAATTS